MGFMAGFGEGFSRSFEQGRQNRAAERQDAFRIAYDQYTKKKEAYDTEESEWNTSIKQGEIIAQRHGAPPEAAIKIAEYLRAGFSESYVDDLVANVRFTATPSTATPQETTPVEPVDAQMTDSGLAPPDVSEQNNPVVAPLPDPNAQGTGATVANPDLLGGVFGPNGPFKDAGKSNEARAAGRVQEAAGIDQVQFDQINNGFQPPVDPNAANITMTPNANDAQNNPLTEFGLEDGITDAKLAAVTVAAKQWEKSGDPELQAKAARWNELAPDVANALSAEDDPEGAAERAKMLSPTLQVRSELSTAKANAITVAKQGMALEQMARATDGKVLTAVAGGVSMFESLKTEFGAVMDLVGQLGNKGTDESSVVAAVEEQIDGMIGQGSLTAETAQQYKEFNAALVRYIYAAGKSLGQAGNGFSNADYENIKNSILTANNQEAFSNNLKRFSQERIQAVDEQVTQLAQSADIQLLLQDEVVGEALQATITPVEEALAGDPVLAWVNGPYEEATDPLSNALPLGTVEGGYEYIGGDPGDPKSWRPVNRGK